MSPEYVFFWSAAKIGRTRHVLFCRVLFTFDLSVDRTTRANVQYSLNVRMRRMQPVYRQEQLDGGESRQICRGHQLSVHFFSGKKYIIRKCFTLKVKVKVTEYSIHGVDIRWRISTSITIILDRLSPALTVFEIFTSQNSWTWICRSRSRCTTFWVASSDGK